MSIFDVLLVVVTLAYGLSGYWQGFVAGAISVIGLLLGGTFGIIVVPWVLDGFAEGPGTAFVAVLLVLLCASVGQAAGAYVGGVLRRRLTWRPIRSLDAFGGAVLSMAALLLMVWAVGYAVSGSRISGLAETVASSRVLGAVDRVVPDGATGLLGSLDEVVGSDVFPRYLEPYTPERIVDVPVPDAAVLDLPGVVGATSSVVRVEGEAECARIVEGSGFVYDTAGDGALVMTNAHVVAGVDEPEVTLGDSTYAADTVVYDYGLDLAVLSVDGLDAVPLRWASEQPGEGDRAVVMGFPEDGPFDARPARVRAVQDLRSPDLYDLETVTREVLSLRGLVRSGNSGGPVISADGEVYGVVFAASLTDDETGYAVTAAQAAGVAEAGRGADEVVSTGGCV